MLAVRSEGGLSLTRMMVEAVRRFLRHDMSTHSAALAFHVVFSAFPFVIVLMALGGFLNLTGLGDWQRYSAPELLPPRSMRVLAAALRELRPPPGGLLSFSAVAALWLSSRGTRALIRAMNVAYDVVTPRPAWKRYLLSIVYTLGIVIMLIAAAVMMTVGPSALEWLATLFGLQHGVVVAWTWLRWPAGLLMLELAIAIVYYAAPNVKHEFRFITLGSVISVVVWVLASAGLRFYVAHMAFYNADYGRVGAIIFLLLYLYVSLAVLLFGAEVNALQEKKAQENARDDRA